MTKINMINLVDINNLSAIKRLLPVVAMFFGVSLAHADCFEQAKQAASEAAASQFPELKQIFVGASCEFSATAPDRARACQMQGGMFSRTGNKQFNGNWAVYVVIANTTPNPNYAPKNQVVTYNVEYDGSSCEVKSANPSTTGNWESGI